MIVFLCFHLEKKQTGDIVIHIRYSGTTSASIKHPVKQYRKGESQ